MIAEGDKVVWWSRYRSPEVARVLKVGPNKVRIEIIDTLGESSSSVIKMVNRNTLQRMPEPAKNTDGVIPFDPEEEVPYMVENAIIEHKSLIPMWKALLTFNPSIDISGDRFGTYDCTIRLTSETDSFVEVHHAANSELSAIYGVIRNTFNRHIGPFANMDHKAVFDDNEGD